MPIMDGYQAMQEILRLRQLTGKYHIQVIALTANVMKGDKEKFLQAGMNDYLAKPVYKKELKAMLQKWLPKENLFVAVTSKQLEIIAEEPTQAIDKDIFLEMKQVMGGQFPYAARMYLADTEFHLNNIKRYMDEYRNPEDIILIGHMLKSSSAYIGAAHLSFLARKLELSAREAADNHQESNTLEPLFQDMKQAFQNVASNFQAYL